MNKPCGCKKKPPLAREKLLTRRSCIECVEKHLGAARVQMSEVFDGYEYRFLVIGHLHEAAEESQEWSKLHEILRNARKDYQANGINPDWEAIGKLVAEIRNAE